MPLVLSGTDGVSGVDGTASNPAIEGTDSNTGIFYPAADTVAIGTGGTERLRVDSAGNAGLGVTPSAWTSASNRKALQLPAVGQVAASGILVLYSNSYYNGTSDVYTTTGAAGVYTINGNVHSWGQQVSGTAGANLNFSTAMTLDASGNLGVGQTSPSGKLDIRTGTTGNYAQFIVGLSGGSSIYYDANTHYFRDGSFTERARITSVGDFLVGKTSAAVAGNGWYVTSDGYSYNTIGSGNTLHVYSSAASAYRFWVSSGGTISATSTTISAISDQRLKENIQDIDVGLDKIMALKPRKFDWKEGKGKDIKGDRGWIAQEFEQVFPDMVSTWLDEPPEGEEPYKSVGADLIPVLVKAIQEQQAMIEEMKAEIQALKGNA